MGNKGAQDRWQQWQASPWGKLRYAVSAANLTRHIDTEARNLSVLDLGGGDGSDSIPYAAQGYSVHIVDRDPSMLARAEERAKRSGLGSSVTLQLGDVETFNQPLAFDIVLLHNVIQYCVEPESLAESAVRAARKGGLVSIITINRYAAALVEAYRHNDAAAALSALDSRSMHADTFDRPVSMFAAEEVRAMLERVGVVELAHYGIRTFNDFIDDSVKFDPDHYADLERLEIAAADKFPYKHTARLFQIVGRIPSAS